MKPRVLVVGRDRDLLALLINVLTDFLGYDVALIDRLHAVTFGVTKNYDLVIVTDSYWRGEAPGIDLALELNKQKVPLILITVYSPIEAKLARVISEGISFIVMPFELNKLLRLAESAVESKETA